MKLNLGEEHMIHLLNDEHRQHLHHAISAGNTSIEAHGLQFSITQNFMNNL
jgi:hypothetical protein